jgi:biopolymer transport protein ExbD
MAGGLASGSDDEPMAEMNLIPLIDISLTLLIILMVTSAFIRQPGISLKLPQTSTREGKPETPKDLTIAVSASGALFVEGKPIADGPLRARLSALAHEPQSRVLIKGDRSVAYERVMHVMDLVRLSGVTRVVLPTDPVRVGPSGLPRGGP